MVDGKKRLLPPLHAWFAPPSKTQDKIDAIIMIVFSAIAIFMLAYNLITVGVK